MNLFTQFVAGGLVALPVVDHRIASQKTQPVDVSQNDGPAVLVEQIDANDAPLVATVASTDAEVAQPEQASQ